MRCGPRTAWGGMPSSPNLTCENCRRVLHAARTSGTALKQRAAGWRAARRARRRQPTRCTGAPCKTVPLASTARWPCVLRRVDGNTRSAPRTKHPTVHACGDSSSDRGSPGRAFHPRTRSRREHRRPRAAKVRAAEAQLALCTSCTTDTRVDGRGTRVHCYHVCLDPRSSKHPPCEPHQSPTQPASPPR